MRWYTGVGGVGGMVAVAVAVGHGDDDDDHVKGVRWTCLSPCMEVLLDCIEV